jgi:hypothetical protein
MWPFKRKFPPLESLPAEDEWSVGQGEHDGKPMIVRKNTSAGSYARHPELPFRLGVAIPLRDPDPRGFPTNAEAETLNEIEDRLCSALGANGRLVVVISTNGMREFISYARSAEIAERAVAQVRAGTKTHEVQHYVEPDPKWQVYDQFAM